MADHDGPGPLAARPGEAHVVALHHLARLLARVERHVGDPREREHEGGQRGVVQARGERDVGAGADGGGKPDGEPAEVDRKHHEGEHAEPKRRRGRQKVAPAADERVRPRAAANARDHAEGEPEHAGDEPRGGEQHGGRGEALRHHGDDGGVVAQAHAKVAAQGVGEPRPVALEQARARAPALGERRPPLRAHREIRRLPHVCLDGVDGRGGYERERHKADRSEQQREA